MNHRPPETRKAFGRSDTELPRKMHEKPVRRATCWLLTESPVGSLSVLRAGFHGSDCIHRCAGCQARARAVAGDLPRSGRIFLHLAAGVALDFAVVPRPKVDDLGSGMAAKQSSEPVNHVRIPRAAAHLRHRATEPAVCSATFLQRLPFRRIVWHRLWPSPEKKRGAEGPGGPTRRGGRGSGYDRGRSTSTAAPVAELAPITASASKD